MIEIPISFLNKNTAVWTGTFPSNNMGSYEVPMQELWSRPHLMTEVPINIETFGSQPVTEVPMKFLYYYRNFWFSVYWNPIPSNNRSSYEVPINYYRNFNPP